MLGRPGALPAEKDSGKTHQRASTISAGEIKFPPLGLDGFPCMRLICRNAAPGRDKTTAVVGRHAQRTQRTQKRCPGPSAVIKTKEGAERTQRSRGRGTQGEAVQAPVVAGPQEVPGTSLRMRLQS